MRTRQRCLPLIILGLGLLASACVPATGNPTPTATPCPAIPLVAPQVFSPNGELVPSLQPTFQWFYDAECAETFGLDIAPDGDFTAPGLIQEQASGPQTTWTLTQSLQPASIYKWRVFAVRGFTTGPYSPALWFWTGPVCDASLPDIPELVSPIQGVIVNDPSPALEWTYPAQGCLAPGFQFEASEQPDFAQAVLSGSSAGPWTSFETNVDFLQDCTDYFWRVAVLHDPQIGDYSDVGEFTTDFQGNCSAASADGVQIYAIGCIGLQSMMITFEFPEPAQDIYQAHAGGNVYECVLNDERPGLLHCSGPRIETEASSLVELIERETQRVVFTGEARFPNCEQPSCVGLTPEACLARADCKWVPGRAGWGAGFCTSN